MGEDLLAVKLEGRETIYVFLMDQTNDADADSVHKGTPKSQNQKAISFDESVNSIKYKLITNDIRHTL